MNWFYNLKLQTKLLSSFIIVALIAGLIGYIGVQNLHKIEALDKKMYEQMTVPISYVSNISTAFQRIRVNLRDLIMADTLDKKQGYIEKINTYRDEIDRNAEMYEKSIFTDEGRTLFKEFMDARNNYIPQMNQIINLSMSGKTTEAKNLSSEDGEAGKASRAEQNAIAKLTEAKEKLAKQASDENAASTQAATATMIILIGIGIGVAVGLGLFITRIISKPMAEIEAVAIRIGNGDLTVSAIDVKSKDELGNLGNTINLMKEHLKEVITKLLHSAEQIAESSTQVNSQAQQTTAGAAETSVTVGEIASTVEQVSCNGQKVAEQARHASSMAAEGRKVSERVAGQMLSISNGAKEASKAISELNSKSTEITKIVDVITNIADQTNLLALNAAIEAARAGDQGRGFAVVAEEVRKLAEQSGSAAEEIRTLISSTQETSHKAVKAMESGAEDIEVGTAIVSEAGKGFVQINTTIENLSTQIQEVAASVEQISAAVQSVAASTEEQTAAMEEVSAAVDTMSELADELRKLGSRFKI